MRQIGNGLDRSFPQHIFDFIQQQRQHNCRYKAEHQVNDPHRQGIAQDTQEIVVGKQKFELLETHPFLFTERLGRPVILESHSAAPDGHIGKKNNVEH
ncbi:hypothetical protein D3C80_1807280 [compost metagenome]